MVWFLALLAIYVVLEQSVTVSDPNPSVALPLILLSPILLAAVPLFKAPGPSGITGYISVLAESFLGSFAVLGIICFALAICCYMHHRRYSQGAAILWAVYVLIAGVPGAIGYWLHRSWPPTERCRQCAADAPRDRDCCWQCGTAFSLPASNGKEIHA